MHYSHSSGSAPLVHRGRHVCDATELPSPHSTAGRRLLEQISRFARDRTAPILLEGESGTGKTTIARELHRLSPRAKGPFEHVVLSAAADGLAGSDLFGHVAGAYTDARTHRTGRFAAAHGGTLFLDEIAKASSTVQGLVLDAIESGVVRPLGAERDVRVDVRVVCATSGDLVGMVERGAFLADLYARIEMFTVRLPPLRERRADIPELIEFYARLKAASAGYALAPEFAPELIDAMVRAEWPGNLRQLSNAVHRLLIEAEGADLVTLDHCRERLAPLRGAARPPSALTMVDIERALAQESGNVTRAAKALGIDRKTLYRKLRGFRDEGDEERPAS